MNPTSYILLLLLLVLILPYYISLWLSFKPNLFTTAVFHELRYILGGNIIQSESIHHLILHKSLNINPLQIMFIHKNLPHHYIVYPKMLTFSCELNIKQPFAVGIT